MRTSFLTLPIAMLLAAGAAAQAPPQARLHLDNAALSALEAKASEVNNVTLDGAVLKLGLAFLNSKNSGLTQDQIDALSKIQGVYVKDLEFSKGGTPPLSDAALAPVRAQLKAPCWNRIVSTHSTGEDNESAEVYVCTGADGNIEGLAVLSREPTEINLVNIVGSIDPAELSKLGGQMGIPKIPMNSPAKAKKGGGE